MSKLPSGWTFATLAELCDYIQRGKSPKYIAVSDLPVINQKCIRWSGVEEQHLKFIDPAQFHMWGPERYLRSGDILWNSTGTGTIGRASFFNGSSTYPRMVADSHVTVVRPSKYVDGRYLHTLIRSPLVQSKINDMQNGSTNQVELSREQVLSTLVPLPSQNEQRKIVAKVKSLTSKLTRVRNDLGHIPKLVRQYKRAILNSAFAGKLTRIDAGRYEVRPFGDVIASTFYGPRISSEAYLERGIPTLRTSDIADWGKIVLDNPPLVSVSKAEYAKWGFIDQDLMVTRTGATIGKCALYEGALGPALPSAYLIRVRLDLKKIIGKFAVLYLLSPSGQDQLLAGRTAVAQPNINAGAISSLMIPIFSLDVQREIVQQVEAAFAWIDRLASEAISARKLTDRLDQAILSKAFRGELVSQDPDDEPASVILERIKAEKTGSTPPRRGRGRPRLAAAT